MKTKDNLQHYNCKKWNHKLAVVGKYYYFDIQNPNLNKLATCSCPLFKNKGITYGDGFDLVKNCKFEAECLQLLKKKYKITIRK